MSSFAQLLWLKRRHLRTELAWWGYIAGADLVEDTDLIDRIYHLYLAVILGAWAVSSWALLLAQVEDACAALGPLARSALPFAMVLLPMVGLAIFSFNAVRTAPLKWTNADVAYVASGAFPLAAIAVADALAPVLASALAGGLLTFLLADGAAASGLALDARALSAFGAVALAASCILARTVGCACATVPVSRRLRRWAVAAGLFGLICALVAAAATWALPGMAELAVSSPMRLLAGALVLLACGAALLPLAASRMDTVRIIEESGAFAQLACVRHLALTAPDTYRELRRRYRVARHRVRPRVPLATGWRGIVTRSLLSHARQFDGVPNLLQVGLVLLPMGAWVLSGRMHPVSCVVWGFVLVMSLGAVRELSLGFREDKRVRLIRDQLPYGDLTLALCDAAPPCAAVVALGEIVLAAVDALAPGSFGAVSFAQVALLGMCLSLAAALDGAEIPFSRRHPSVGAGVIAVALVAGLFSLLGPGAVVCGLVALALAFAAILARSR